MKLGGTPPKDHEIFRNRGTMPPFVGSNAQWALHTDRGQGEAWREREGEEGEEEKEKRKRQEKMKLHQARADARLCRYKNSPP